MQTLRIITAATLAALGVAACNSDSTSSSTTTTATTTTTTTANSATAFPLGLAVASPLATHAAGSALREVTARGAFSSTSSFITVTAQISGLLDGTVSASTAFKPQDFLHQSTNADCFGPTLNFASHSDDVSRPSGQLPSGDLGIWKESDSGGSSCAAAQLNAKMQAISDRSTMGLVGLASMIGAAKAIGVALPTAGHSVNLMGAMNSLAIPDTNFTDATLSLDSGGTVWSYSLTFTYTDSSAVAHNIVINMQHTPGSDTSHYQGSMRYQVDDKFVGGNCPGSYSNATTYNGSLYYKRVGANSMTLNARDGMYCGNGKAARLVKDSAVDSSASYDFVDPADKFDTTTGKGWANNFSIIGAQLDPSTLKGYYTYAWQAGPQDGHARVFSVGVNYNTTTALTDGEAYFGFGDDIGTSDGSVKGFYCSWAGPGPTHTMQNYAQRQFISYDASSGKFLAVSGGSDITYAPTNACTYTASDPAGFTYDRDKSGTIDSSDIAAVYPTSGATPSGALTLDMMQAYDLDHDGTATIAEQMANRGWVQPPL